MKKSVAMKWVKSLRSGEFHQGSRRLKKLDTTSPTGVSYCCLGVLCEISEVESKLSNKVGIEDSYEFLGDVFRLNEKLIQKFGMNSSLGMLPGVAYEPNISLATLNDSGLEGVERLTFDEIADIIQICYKEL